MILEALKRIRALERRAEALEGDVAELKAHRTVNVANVGTTTQQGRMPKRKRRRGHAG